MMKERSVMKRGQSSSGLFLPLVSCFLLFFAAAGAEAGMLGKKPGEAGFSFLKLPTSARTASMGESFSAIDLDIQGAEYNPSVTAQMEGGELWFSHLSYLEGVNVESVQFARALGFGGLNFSSKYLRVKESERDGLGNEVGTFIVSDLLIGLGYGFSIFDVLDLGGHFKYLNETLGPVSAKVIAADAGAAYHFVNFPLSVGLSVQNLGAAASFDQESVQLPLTLRAGVSGKIVPELTLAADAVQVLDKDVEGRFGFEYKFTKVIYVRGGYKLVEQGVKNFSGTTVGFGFHGRRMALDYAFVPYDGLGMTHRISLGLRWGKKK